MCLPLRLLAAVALASIFWPQSAYGGIVIEKAEREINAAKYIVLERQTVTYKNTGSQPVSEILLCHPTDQAANRAFFEVVEGIEDDSPELLVKAASQEGLPGNVTCETAVLAAPLKPGKSTILETYAVLVRVLQPRPREIKQEDPQRVQLLAPQHVVSPYTIASESTQVRLPSKAVEFFSGRSPSARSGSSVNFGPYEKVDPWAGGQLRVHFENNGPFAEALSLMREIQVSHWGNVYVEEWYTIKHMGARQTGEWSRLRYMQDARRHGAAAIRDFSAILPRSAHSLYFRDEIGNVSTSGVRRLRDKLDVRLQPRFTLFGGWQVEFVFGYSLPLASVVSTTKGGLRKLELPFSSPIQNLLVADLTVKVVLPEGSSLLNASLPFPVEEAREKKYTYLDTAGRPVLVLHKADVVPDHNVPLAVTYSFSNVYLLQEPLLLIAAFFALFCAVIVCVRCDFALLPPDEKVKTL